MLPVVSLFLFSNSAGLTVDNLKAGEIFRYPVISVRGTCGTDSVSLGLTKDAATSAKATNGRYIGLIELKPGANTVYTKAGSNVLATKVFYQPMKTPYKVHAIWYVSSDEGNDYPYAKPGEKQKLNEKLDTMLKMMQTFTAEAMDEAGYGKKTFALDTDKDGKVVVSIVKSTKTGVELRAEDGGKTWGDGYGQIKKLFNESTQKYASLIAFSRWDTEKQKGLGAFALGGGALAMMYGGTVSLYPNSIAEVQDAFLDTEFIDPTKTYEDSAFRKTRWANVSTAYGAFLHELGHTFGLPHCADGFGIMSRGFDRFNRRFMLTEPPVHGQEKGAEFKADQIARWDKFHSARLNWSPWFQADGKNGGEFERKSPPTITVDGDKVTVESVRGIRTAGAELDDKFPFFKEYKDRAPLVVTFSLDELRKEIKSKDKVRITAIDTEGNQTVIDK